MKAYARRSFPLTCLMALAALFLALSAIMAPSEIPILGAAPAQAAGSPGWRWQCPNPQGNQLHGVSASDAGRVWAVGNYGTTLMWNGAAWISRDSGTTKHLFGVAAVDSTHVWAVGAEGTILFWDGSGWTPQTSGVPSGLIDVAAVDANHAWAVGVAGTILSYSGSNWISEGSGTTATLRSVFALDAQHIWAVGDGGLILYSNGKEWKPQPSGTTKDLLGVSAVDASHVWVVGKDGTILFGNGSSWKPQPSGTPSYWLTGVSALDADHVWAAGDYGTVLFRGYPPAVKLLTPNGGEVLAPGATYTVSWEAPTQATHFELQWSLDNGVTWRLIAAGLTGGSYAWTVPKAAANRSAVLLRVIGYSSSGATVGSDQSDAALAIQVARLIKPNGGETLRTGKQTTISWLKRKTIRPVASIKLYLSKNGGGTWQLIKSFPPTSTSYLWTIAAASSSTCKIKVVLKDAAGVAIGTDASDKPFTISP